MKLVKYQLQYLRKNCEFLINAWSDEYKSVKNIIKRMLNNKLFK